MKHLYYIRHGESEANANDVWGGVFDSPLTELGRKQATQTGKDIKKQGLKFDIIISSPLKRAYETATLIAAEIGYPSEKIDTHSLLMERNFGVMDGKPGARNFVETNGREALDKIEGAETIEQLQGRAAQAIKHLESLPYDTILVVAHGSFGRAIRRHVNKQPHSHEYNGDKPIPNAELIRLV